MILDLKALMGSLAHARSRAPVDTRLCIDGLGAVRAWGRASQTFAGVALGAVTGCGEPDLALTNEPAAASEHEILNELDVAGQRVQFIEMVDSASPEALLMVHSLVSAGDRELVGRLLDSNGPLTLLEIFLALAPDDAAPHPALVRSHAREALALKRSDVDAVLELTVDGLHDRHVGGLRLKVALPPDALETCEESLFQETPTEVWTRVRSTPHTGGPPAPPEPGFFCAGIGAGFWFPPGDDICSSFFTQVLRVGLCHLAPDSPPSAYQFAASFTGSPMSYTNPATLTSGQVAFTTFAASATPKRAAVVNFPGEGDYAYVMATAVGEPP
jgi:hypothetical protein